MAPRIGPLAPLRKIVAHDLRDPARPLEILECEHTFAPRIGADDAKARRCTSCKSSLEAFCDQRDKRAQYRARYARRAAAKRSA